MKVKCDYCGSYFEDTKAMCPYCAASNNYIRRTTEDIPGTIEELKYYCDQNGFISEKTRFFIDEDYEGAKAFGIYRNASGECVVYKNKSDGSRSIHYQGKDEAYAVNEIFLKLQTEIVNQKNVYKNERINRNNYIEQHQPEKEENKLYAPLPRWAYALGLAVIIVPIIALSIHWHYFKKSMGDDLPRVHAVSHTEDYRSDDSYDYEGSGNGYYNDSWDSSTDDWSSDDWDSDLTDWDSDW